MNSRAFFSSLLSIAFAFFLLSFLAFSTASLLSLNTVLNASLELEKASMQRSIAEQNTDFLISRTIELQALEKQLSSHKLSAAIHSNLASYFARLESLEGFSFFQTEYYFPDYSRLSQSQAIPFFSFSDEFKVNVVRLGKHLSLVTASYSGGRSGKSLVFAKISPRTQELFFLVPFGYTVKKLVVS